MATYYEKMALTLGHTTSGSDTCLQAPGHTFHICPWAYWAVFTHCIDGCQESENSLYTLPASNLTHHVRKPSDNLPVWVMTALAQQTSPFPWKNGITGLESMKSMFSRMATLVLNWRAVLDMIVAFLCFSVSVHCNYATCWIAFDFSLPGSASIMWGCILERT